MDSTVINKSTTSMRSHKFRHNYHKNYVAMKKGTYDYSKIYRVFHKHGTLLESGWYDTQTWGALHKAWLGYVIAKIKMNMTNKYNMLSSFKNYKKNMISKCHAFHNLDCMQ